MYLWKDVVDIIFIMLQISQYQRSSKQKSFELPEAQERTIKEILLQM